MYLSIASNSDVVPFGKVGKGNSLKDQYPSFWSGRHAWLTPCEIVQRLQRLRILEQRRTIDFFQLLTTIGQKFVEIPNGLLIGT